MRRKSAISIQCATSQYDTASSPLLAWPGRASNNHRVRGGYTSTPIEKDGRNTEAQNKHNNNPPINSLSLAHALSLS